MSKTKKRQRVRSPADYWPAYVIVLNNAEDRTKFLDFLQRSKKIYEYPDDRIRAQNICIVRSQDITEALQDLKIEWRFFPKEDVLKTRKEHLLKTFKVTVGEACNVYKEALNELSEAFRKSLVLVLDHVDDNAIIVKAAHIGLVRQEIRQTGIQEIEIQP